MPVGDGPTTVVEVGSGVSVDVAGKMAVEVKTGLGVSVPGGIRVAVKVGVRVTVGEMAVAVKIGVRVTVRVGVFVAEIVAVGVRTEPTYLIQDVPSPTLETPYLMFIYPPIPQPLPQLLRRIQLWVASFQPTNTIW